MKFLINLSPQVRDNCDSLFMAKQGATLFFQNRSLDLSFLADGDILAAGAIEHPLLLRAEIRRRGDVVEIDSLVFPISASCSDFSSCFPQPIHIVQDGIVSLPDQGFFFKEVGHADKD